MTDRPVLAFLEGQGTDGAGRTVFEVLGLNDPALEHSHDFIQWLFPLEEPSQAVPSAPVLQQYSGGVVAMTGS